MVKVGRFMYGTVRECVNEIWKRIDIDEAKFPDFDFCDDPGLDDSEDIEKEMGEAKEGTDLGSGWYGVKANDDFDPGYTSINVICGYYGGGAFEGMAIDEYDDVYKESFLRMICNVSDMEPEWKTVVEFVH